MLARAMADSALSAGAFIRSESRILPSDSSDLTRENASDSAISRNNADNRYSFSAKRASNIRERIPVLFQRNRPTRSVSIQPIDQTGGQFGMITGRLCQTGNVLIENAVQLAGYV